MISILSKLNFDTETFEVVLSNSNDIVAESQTQQGTLTQVLNEEVFENDDVMMVSTVNKPVKIKDHTILANLVSNFLLLFPHKTLQIFQRITFLLQVTIIDGIDDFYNKSLQPQLLKSLILQARKYPEVSGFYKILGKILKNYERIEATEDTNPSIVSPFLLNLVKRCQSFEHELLRSCKSL